MTRSQLFRMWRRHLGLLRAIYLYVFYLPHELQITNNTVWTFRLKRYPRKS